MNQKRIITVLTTLALFSMALFTLLGCQPTAGEPAAESSTATAVATATEVRALAEAPKATQTPTATTVVTETATQTEKMEPTTAPSEATATTEAIKPESVAPDSAEPAIIYERSGGYAGLTDHWEIYADGRITYNNGNNRVMEWQVDPADVTQLHTEIIAADFFTLESNYVPKNACCDLFTYSLTVTDGTQTLTTSTVDQEPSTPDNLWTALDLVQVFIMDNTT